MNTFSIPFAKGLSGTLTVPGDKSISHRSLIFAALAQGKSRISNLLLGEDVLSTLGILRDLGVSTSHAPHHLKAGDELEVEGRGLHSFKAPQGVLNCGNSGTTMRLMMGLLSAQPFQSSLTGDESLNRRPMERVMNPLKAMGADFEIRQVEGERHIVVKGNADLKGIHYPLPVASAQLKSALLLAGLYAKPSTTVVEVEETRDHTERMLQSMGVDLKIEGLTKTITPPTQPLKPLQVQVPGDFSSAAFFMVAGLIVPHSQITIQSVGLNPSRIALLSVLRKMGGAIELLNERVVSGEPVGDLKVSSSPLQPIEVGGALIPNLIDEIPILAVAMACAQGRSEVKDAGELRVKESDRISTVVKELKKLGVDIEEKPDGFVIKGGRAFQGNVFQSHGDHRIAMSLAIASLLNPNGATIEDVGCVATSFPGFYDLLTSLLV